MLPWWCQRCWNRKLPEGLIYPHVTCRGSSLLALKLRIWSAYFPAIWGNIIWPIWGIRHCSLLGPSFLTMPLFLNWRSPFYPTLPAWPLTTSTTDALDKRWKFGPYPFWFQTNPGVNPDVGTNHLLLISFDILYNLLESVNCVYP